MTDLLASEVIVLEEAAQVISVPSLPTAVAGMVVVTEKGPFGPRLATGYDEWARIYGGYTANSEAAKAAAGFFRNGGEFLWTIRTVHMTDFQDPATRISAAATINITTTGAATQGSVTSGNTEPFALDPADTVVVKVDAGGNETATFDAAAALRTGSGGTYVTGFTGGETLLVKIDGGEVQTVTFTSGDQTLAQVVSRVNIELVDAFAQENTGELEIVSDKKGTGSYVEVTGGTGAATLGMSVGSSQGTGDVADIDAVTATEAKTIIEADTTAEVTIESGGEITIKTPTIGAGGSIQVDASSTADDATKFDLDNGVHTGSAAGPGDTGTVDAYSDGLWGDSLKVKILAATSGDSDEFNMQILENDIVRESWINLTTFASGARYWETIVNISDEKSDGYIILTDLLAGSAPTNRPDNGTYSLTGGDDGLTGLVDNDFIGSVGSGSGPTGIYELDAVEDLTLLFIPGRATAAVHQAMVEYGEDWRKRQVFSILDPPAGYSATEIRDYARVTASLFELSEMAAIYWPRIKVLNPDETLFTSDENGLIVVPPSGYLAGVYARTDGNVPGGIHQPPAGIERGIIRGCLGFETDETLDQKKRDIVYPANINPLTVWTGVPRHIDGTRCLKTSGNWGTVAERRGMSFIERAIKLLLAFARHSNNDRALRRRAARTLAVFLLGQMHVGAFRTRDPATSFSVDFSDKLNPPSVVLAKKLRGRVGVKKAKTVDWVIVDVFEDTGLDEELAG